MRSSTSIGQSVSTSRLVALAASALLCALLPGTTHSQGAADVEIRPVPVADGVYMLLGQGGNIGLLVGPDGAVLIDDQFAPLTEKIVAAVAKLGDTPVRLVINTHWHGDHTGGNENLGKAGAVILAHGNVRERMSAEQAEARLSGKTPTATAKALPVITFESELTLHLNGQTLEVFHVSAAHTDGDAIIRFVEAGAYHMGDTYWNGFYPFIDIDSGGSIAGTIAAQDRVLAAAAPSATIIPGHGPISNVTELRAARDMLTTVRDRVAAAIAAGKSADALIAENPLADLDAKWGKGFIGTERFLRGVHADLSR